MAYYDVLVYHDLSDDLGDPPLVGDDAGEWLGKGFENHYVVAVAPGIHEGRTTVVVAFGKRPMPEIAERLRRGVATG